MYLKDAEADIKGFQHTLTQGYVVANLNVTDMAIAAVLGGLNLLLVGDTGCGKTACKGHLQPLLWRKQERRR